MARPTLVIAVVVAFAAAAMLTPQPSAAATIHVDGAATGAGTGLTWQDAFTDLQPALDLATAGDEVWVAAGTYHPTAEVGGTGDRFRAFGLVNEVGVYGGFAGDETDRDQRDWTANPCILSGDIGVADDVTDNCLHVFHHPSGSDLDATACLDGFTITGAYGDLAGDSRRGGGMFNEDAEPTLANCTFLANTVTGSSYARGGAMYNEYCSPTLVDCEFAENFSASQGGAIYNAGYSGAQASPSMTRCLFADNVAGEGGNGEGGAIYNSTYCVLVMVDCAFTGNSAQYNGGAIANNGYGGGHWANCVFDGNTAGMWGGAIYNQAETELVCVNTLFVGNEVTAGNSHGGALYNIACDPVLVNCVLYDNTSGCVGKGVYNIQFADAVFANCILDGEWCFYNGADCDVQVTYCCLEQEGFEDPALHNVYASPQFVDAAGGDFHLAAGSPCIDAGDNLALPVDVWDLDGDGDTAEPVPCDFEGDLRCQDDADTEDTGGGTAPFTDIGLDELNVAVAAPDGAPAAARLALAGYPNPFNPRTTIRFTLPADGHARVRVLDVLGRQVRLLADHAFAAGEHTVAWDGRDDRAHRLPAGSYLVLLEQAGARSLARVSLVK